MGGVTKCDCLPPFFHGMRAPHIDLTEAAATGEKIDKKLSGLGTTVRNPDKDVMGGRTTKKVKIRSVGFVVSSK
jgi:hypothetical protein